MGYSSHVDVKVSNSYENHTSKSRSRRWNYCWLFAIAAMSHFGVGMAAKTHDVAPLVKVGETKLKHSRYGAAAAVLGDSIYVFGGSTAGAISYIERINSRTLEVEQLPGKLVARRYHSVIEHEGKFYFFGGQGFQLRGNDPYERLVEIYDPATNTVTNGPAMRHARAFMATAKLGAIYQVMFPRGGDM